MLRGFEMEVRAFSTTNYIELTPASTIGDTLQAFLLQQQDIGCVMKDGSLIGIISKYAIYRLLLQGASLDTPIASAIKKQVVTIRVNDSLAVAQQIMIKTNVSHAVVLEEDGSVFGVMAKSDFIKSFLTNNEYIEGRMKFIFENLQEAVLSIDHDRRITAYNRAAADLLQFGEEDMLGHIIEEVSPALSPDLLLVLATGAMQEAKQIPLDHLTVIASFIPITEWNQRIGAMVVLRDVTAYERISRELDSTKQLERILDSALELAYDGILITDQHGTITKANQGLIELYHYDQIADVIGKPIRQIAPEIPIEKSLQADTRVEGELIQVNGTRCIVTQMPIYRDNQKVGAMIKIIFRQLNLWKDLFHHMEKLEHEITFVRGELLRLTTKNDAFARLVGASKEMFKLKEEAYIAAQSSLSVLITGESGTGKGILAEGIHFASGREGAFVKVNCAAIPAELLESEFFGYADGAFTGAKKGGKPGKFELADRGTLFLDEIGDMPLALQAKLLRVLQDGEFDRVGDTTTRRVDVRIITATNRDLKQLVEQKKFREDLYYRIHVIHLHLPPLSARTEDIPVICNDLLIKINERIKKSIKGLTPEVLHIFLKHPWPGNVRELENVLERAAHFCDSSWIEPKHLPADLLDEPVLPQTSVTKTSSHPKPFLSDEPLLNRRQLVEETERKALLLALQKEHGNRTKAAALLGISRAALYQKLRKYKITQVSDFRIFADD
ncbi:MAG: sigma 54-interacting transcriptional regulator [Clostridia bacterium]